MANFTVYIALAVQAPIGEGEDYVREHASKLISAEKAWPSLVVQGQRIEVRPEVPAPDQ